MYHHQIADVYRKLSSMRVRNAKCVPGVSGVLQKRSVPAFCFTGRYGTGMRLVTLGNGIDVGR